MLDLNEFYTAIARGLFNDIQGEPGPTGPGAGVDNLLLESGDNFLLEDGTSVLLLESA